MVKTSDKHPMRCETCNNKDCENHPTKIEYWKTHNNKAKALNVLIRQGHIEEMGCASHSSMTEPEPDMSTSEGFCLLGGSLKACLKHCKHCKVYIDYITTKNC
jgi:hypothetical protein